MLEFYLTNNPLLHNALYFWAFGFAGEDKKSRMGILVRNLISQAYDEKKEQQLKSS